MDVHVETRDVFTSNADGLILFTYEEGCDAENHFKTKLGPNIVVARARKEFEGKAKQVFVEKQAGTPRFFALVGLGKKEKIVIDTLRGAAATVAESLRSVGAKTIAFSLPQELDAETAAQAVVEGAVLRTYQFNTYKTQKLDEIKMLNAIILLADETSAVAVKKGVELGKTITDSCNFVRDLQNTPSIDMTPQIVAEKAAKLAKEEKLRCTILDERQLRKQGYNALLSVGKGSSHPPRLVTLEYAPKGAKQTIALVGKGITFDTGGISIKPSAKMSEMKFDMSGAANVLGVLRNASRLKLSMRIIGVLVLAENMPDGNSYKPGDIVKTKNGKTIEIDNTDAEGRVVLSDGLHHATTFKPDVIIDMATLTGACVVALGPDIAGIFSKSDRLTNKVVEASKFSGEPIWQMPLPDDYFEMIKSEVADVKNAGQRWGGAITAALFLREFVDSKIPWAHIDIAGPCFVAEEKPYQPYKLAGGTGVMVRTMLRYLEMQN